MKTDVQISMLSALCGCFLVTIVHGQEISSDAPQSARPQRQTSVGLEDDVHPLKPAETSSPRDTLRGFMADTQDCFMEWSQNGQIQSATAYQAYSRAVSTLDFSTTPRGNAPSIQTVRLLLLREILDRLEIPEDASVGAAPY